MNGRRSARISVASFSGTQSKRLGIAHVMAPAFTRMAMS
jgi:hypothetical protein